MLVKNTERSAATAMKAFLTFVFSKMDCRKAEKEYVIIVRAADVAGVDRSVDQKKKSEMDLLQCVLLPDGLRDICLLVIAIG